MNNVDLKIDELEYCIRIAHEDVSQSIVREQLKELIRLATIGKCIDLIFINGYYLERRYQGFNDKTFMNIEDIVEWAEKKYK